MINFWLLAAADLGSAFRAHSKRSGSLDNNWYLVAAVVAIAVFWTGLYYWDRHRKQNKHQGKLHNSLFLELCEAHGLNRAEQGVLKMAAASAESADQAALFVDPSLLRGKAASDEVDSKEYGELAGKLFGSI